ARQRGQRGLEFVRVLRPVVRPARRLRDLLERGLVQGPRVAAAVEAAAAAPASPAAAPAAAVELGAFADHGCRAGGAEADGEHPYPAGGGFLGGGLRVDALGVGAVGEDDDGGARVSLAGGAGGGAGGGDGRVGLGDGVDGGEHGLADGGAAADEESVERFDEGVGVVGGRDEQAGAAREGDEADAWPAALRLDELGGGLARGGEPVGVDV